VIAYIDSSVILRILLSEPDMLLEWPDIHIALVSSLLRVESCRTLDRYVHNAQLSEAEYSAKLAKVENVLDQALVLEIDEPLLHAASRRLPVRLATLDAIHLATAERFREALGPRDPFVFATHDRELAAAARASGFEVVGITL
jgi:predicted nucleic acid-binding protein